MHLDGCRRIKKEKLLEEVLLGEGELCRDLFEESELRRLLTTLERGELDLTKPLFLLLSLGLWHRGFVAEGVPAEVSL